jgi:hypothetical protein
LYICPVPGTSADRRVAVRGLGVKLALGEAAEVFFSCEKADAVMMQNSKTKIT